MKTTIKIDVDIPEGYEATGEYRVPENEPWLDGYGHVYEGYPNGGLNRIILRRKKLNPPKFFIRGNSIYVEREGAWIFNFWVHRSDIPKIIEALEHCADWIDEHGEK